MTKPRFTALAQSLPSTVPFVGPEAAERAQGKPFTARLGANESVFGPSPEAIAAMEAAAKDVWMYADPESHDLRHALAEHHGIAADEVVIGAGIDGLLGSTVRLFVEQGDSVVTSDGAYPTFNFHVAGYGGVLHKVPFKDDHEDLDALLNLARETDAKLVYLSNPDNPMASAHPADTVQRMIDNLPTGCLLVLDEAYVECAPDGTAPRVDTSNPNVLRFRTFSKGYGMAGARIGYVFGHRDVIRGFEKVRNHFGLNRIAQIGALAALEDQSYLAEVLRHIEHARKRISEICQNAGLAPLPSATNFVTVDCGRDSAYSTRILEELVARGIFARKPFASPGDRCIRISCGRDSDIDLFEAALPDAITAANG